MAGVRHARAVLTSVWLVMQAAILLAHPLAAIPTASIDSNSTIAFRSARSSTTPRVAVQSAAAVRLKADPTNASRRNAFSVVLFSFPLEVSRAECGGLRVKF
jgi:hypothetical protein